MTDYYPVIEILPEWAPQTEGMGSKVKFWYLWEQENPSHCLFKHPRPNRGEHWAEKIAAEVAGLIQISCAKRQLAGYFVLDALVGNTDRHSENWGVLQSQDGSRRIDGLAPSYDHGSSLGRELMDERRERLLSDNRVGGYVERGRGQIHWQNIGRRGPGPLELIRLSVAEYPDIFRPAIAKLDILDDLSLSNIVDSIPQGWMIPGARAFAFELMRYSCAQLREVI